MVSETQKMNISLPNVVDVMDARRPNMQENGREMAIALEPIFLTCPHDNIRSSVRNERTAFRSNWTYQKLLKKTKVSKHADNDKNRNILPNPEKV